MEPEGHRRGGRAARKEQRLTIGPGDLQRLADEASRLVGGGGWITVAPLVPEDDRPEPDTGPISSLFSAGRHEVPLCSWVPARQGRRAKPDSLGIQHSTGTKSAARLAARGVPVPGGWKVLQDHPRRGLVVAPPVGTSVEAMFDWLLRAGSSLSKVDFDGRWDVRIHRAR